MPEKSPLQRAREQHGLKQVEAAQEICNVIGPAHGYTDLGLDANAVSRHERGKVRPRDPYPELYAALYGRPPEELFPDHKRVRANARAYRRRPVRALWPWGLFAGAEDQDDEPEVAGLVVPLLGRHVEEADVARVCSDTELFGLMDQRHGGGHVRWLVVDYLRREVAPLLHGSYSDRVGRELLAAAAVLTRRAGMMAYDAGRHASARHDFAQALQLARGAGHQALAAHVLTSMSHQAIDLGRTSDALAMLEAARQDAAGAAAPTLLAKVAVMQARLHARLGNASDCERALLAASGASEQADHARDPDWIASTDQPYLLGQFGTCYLDLGRPARAERYVRQAFGGHRPDFVRRRAMGATLLARSLLDQGELQEACNLGVQAVTLTAGLKSRRALAAVADLHGRLAPYRGEQVAKDLAARAAALLGTAPFEDARAAPLDLGGAHGGTAGPMGHRPDPAVCRRRGQAGMA
jgi:tetratricopeptide (TPR) repeat protein